MSEEIIGDCRLILGDCSEVIQTLNEVDCVVTDPPYNVGKNYGNHNDSMPEGQYREWISNIIEKSRKIASNQFWVAPRYKLDFFLPLFPKAHLIVITRGAQGPFRAGWSDQFEIAIAEGKPENIYKDLWMDIRLKGEGYFFREETYGHDGYTPYKIMSRAVNLLGGDSVLDMFMGTGGTGVACVESGKKFIGIDNDENSFNIACERISRAERQGDLFRPKHTQESMDLL